MKLKSMIVIVILSALIFFAVVLYPKLSEQYLNSETTTIENEESETMPSLAQDFTVEDVSGNSVSLSDFLGKPVVVNFWATWCPYCVEELPAFDSVYASYGNDVAFMIIDLTDGIDETKEEASKYIEEQNFSFPVYFDTQSSAATAYSLRSIPMTIFVDTEGYLSGYHMGAMDEATLCTYVESLKNKD